MCDDAAAELGAVSTKRSEAPYGTDEATWCDLTLPNGGLGLMVFVTHQNIFASILVVMPRAMADNPEIKAFIHSLKFP